MNKWVKRIIYLLIFIASMALIIIEQKTIGKVNLLLMMLGLAGLVFLLYQYNKKYQ